MNYKTPGVYVEEHEKFPPSVAQVETAIPAFIGYTAEGQKNKPTRITSMLEYEQLFGKANPETFAVAFEDGVASATQTKVSDFKMYYNLQMYFANGGGPCYIVAVNHYKTGTTVNEVKFNELIAGLDLLEKEDEPTLGLVKSEDKKATASPKESFGQSLTHPIKRSKIFQLHIYSSSCYFESKHFKYIFRRCHAERNRSISLLTHLRLRSG